MQSLEQAESTVLLVRRRSSFLSTVLCSGFLGFPHLRQQIKQMEEKGGKKKDFCQINNSSLTEMRAFLC